MRIDFGCSDMKDFYDIWLLIQQFDFDLQELQGIIHQVLRHLGTSAKIPSIAFLESFHDNQIKKDKWNAFFKGYFT